MVHFRIQEIGGRRDGVPKTEKRTEGKALKDIDEFEPRIMINELLRVQIPDDPNSGNCYSRVKDVAGKILLMTWPTENGVLLPVHTGQTLAFSMTRKGNAYFFRGLADKIEREPTPLVTIIMSGEICRIQRREDFRVKCLIPVEVAATLSGTSGGLRSSTLRLKTNTYDLSASGLSIRVATVIPEKTLPVVKLSLPDQEPPINAPCRVKHCFVPPDNPNRFHIGMQFIGLDAYTRSRILRYIHHAQLKRIRL